MEVFSKIAIWDMEKGRGKRREKRERAGASSGPFAWSWGALTEAVWTRQPQPRCACTSSPHTHTKCTAVDPERPASIAQGARSQRAHWPSRLLPSPLMLADMPQPLQSSRITPPASASDQHPHRSPLPSHTHGHTDLAHIFRHCYHTNRFCAWRSATCNF